MYAAHDGSRGPIECLGLERADGEPPRFEKVLWSSLAHIVASGPYQDDGRTAWVFACRWNDELAEEFDASGEPICPGADEDEFFAVDALTEEVLFFHPKAGWSIEAPHLRDTLQRVVRALAAEATFDEAGWLVKRKPTPEVARERPAELSESVVVELARALVDRHVVELREGTRVEGFAAALDAALASKTKEAKAQGVRDVFDGSLVDEVFADDDELDELVKSIVNRLG